MEEYKNVYEKLLYIQGKVKVLKSQYSEFGDYYFRSCEDIQNAVKPFAHEVNAVCTCSDEIVYVDGRWYVKATARLIDCESGNMVETTAYAGEEAEKKKLDKSQVTGVASSYARKYALGGLFQLDDTKDSDGLGGDKDEKPKQLPKQEPKKTEKKEEEKKETLTLEKAKAMTFIAKGVEHKLGECNSEQLLYLRDHIKEQELLDGVELILTDMARNAYTDQNENNNQE